MFKVLRGWNARADANLRPPRFGSAFHEKALFGRGDEFGLGVGSLGFFARFRANEKSRACLVVYRERVAGIGGVVFEGNPFAVPVFLSCGGREFWGERFDVPEVWFFLANPVRCEVAVTQQIAIGGSRDLDCG